ncbi:MAG: hypothetical protein WCD89_19500 [Anaerocolumna sp.]
MKRTEKNMEEELISSFKQWEHLYRHGGGNPFWSDGGNLNLVRNHILHYKNQLKEKNHIPEIFYKETPPEVDQNYMTRTEEIRVNAVKSLRAYLASEDYIYLLNNMYKLKPKQQEETHIGNILGYVSGLRQDILSDDLAAMRRHENHKCCMENFHECRIKLDRISELNQITLKFDPGNQISG